MDRNDKKDEIFILEARLIVNRIHKAIEKKKGIRLSSHEMQILSITLFADETVVSE